MNKGDRDTLKTHPRHINKSVETTLTIGMNFTVGVYLIGLVLAFVSRKAVPAIPDQYFKSIGGFFLGLSRFEPQAFLFLGTLSLILTPVVCVFTLIVAFWRSHDYKYVGVAIIIFLVIVASVIVGTVFKSHTGA